jgi:hypothetical protein
MAGVTAQAARRDELLKFRRRSFHPEDVRMLIALAPSERFGRGLMWLPACQVAPLAIAAIAGRTIWRR